MTSDFLGISPKIACLPIIHGSGDYAIEVRRRMLAARFVCLAVPLPPSFQEDVERAVVEEANPLSEHRERREAEDPPVEGDGERGGGKGEVDAGQAEGGEGHERTDGGGHDGGGDDRQRVAVGTEVAHDHGTDAAEAELAERDPAGVSHQGHERKADEGQAPHLGAVEQVTRGEDLREHHRAHDDRHGEE